MATWEEYKKQNLQAGQAATDAKNKVATDTATKNIETINNQYGIAEQNLQDKHNADVADTNESYENAFKQNEVQRLLNERYIERKAAEMGLTDSGMNRTQQTAVQLSYANQKGTLTTQRQKAIDTLAATLRANMSSLNSEKAAKISAEEITRDNTIAQNNADLNTWASEQATTAWNAEQDRIEEQGKAAATDKDNLIKNLNNSEISEISKRLYLEDYISKHGADAAAVALVKDAGMFLAAGKVWHPSEFSFYELEDSKEALGQLARIFHANSYGKDYKKAAFALYCDTYGTLPEDIVEGLLYVSNISYDTLMGGI